MREVVIKTEGTAGKHPSSLAVSVFFFMFQVAQPTLDYSKHVRMQSFCRLDC